MKKHLRASTAVLLLAALVTCTGGTSLGEQARAGLAAAASTTLVYGSAVETDTLNPITSAQGTGNEVATAVFDSLLVPDPHGRLQPDLATSVTHSADGRTFTFHLRHGVEWADGVPFTSADVAYNYQAIMDKTHNVAVTSGWDQIDRYSTPDPYTFVCHLKSVYAPFLVWVGQSLLIPKHIYDRPGVDFNTTAFNSAPFGTGAYRVKEWVHGDHITLVANPHWWRGRPFFQTVVYDIAPDNTTLLTQLGTGELDLGQVLSSQASAAAALPGKRLVTWVDNSFQHVELMQYGFLREQVVRQALDYATPKQAILQGISHGMGAVANADVLPTFTAYYNPHVPTHPFNLAKAAALLAADGFRKGADGVLEKQGTPFVLTLWADSRDANGQKINQVLQEEWGLMGIKVSLKALPFPAFRGAAGPFFTKAMGALDEVFGNNPDPDDSPAWVSSAIPKSATDTTCCNDEAYLHPYAFQAQIDALYQAGNSTLDPGKRRAIFFTIQSVLADEVPMIFLYWLPRLTVVPTNLSGYVGNAFYPPFAQVGSWRRI